MIDNEILFYKREKSRFDELLNELGWTEDSLLKEVCFRYKIFEIKTTDNSSKKH